MDDTTELSQSEQAYFETRGEADPTSAPATQVEEGAAEPTASADVEFRPERDERRVPYGALAEERARRKDLQRQLGEMRAREEALRGRLRDLLPSEMNVAAENIAGPDGEPAEPAEPVTGPEELDTQGIDPVEAANQSQAGENYVGAVREFMAERPDFVAAYRHAIADRARELIDLGYSLPEARRITNENEWEIVQRALAQGRNPAEVIYNHAMRRGYRPAGPAPSNLSPASFASARQSTSEAERVALAAKGQAGAKSLSASGGGAGAGIGLEALARMSDEEFAAATSGERWEKLMR